MVKRINISSGTKWEAEIGYSRAVKVGNIIEISGTTAIEDNEIIGKGDPYLQTKTIIEKIKRTLESAGSSLKDVVRVRLYVTDITFTDEVTKAFTEYFYEIKPAATLVAVISLIEKDLLVEIEATAIITAEQA